MANGVTIDLIVDPKKAILGLGQVESRSTSLSNVLGKLGGVAAAGIAALGVATAAAGAATTAFVVSSVKAAAEAQKITAQTAAVLTSTGGAAGKSADQIDALAKSLSRISGLDDETVKTSENLLLTFTAIKGTNFDKAQQAVLDLSQSMGKDLSSSTILVGKALNNPLTGLTSLTRVGVKFTAQQKEQIANFVKMGDVASAQGVILQELNTEFGGSAAAFGNTFLGSVGRAKNALLELKEEIGAAFLPALTAAASSVAGVLNAVTDNPKFKAFIDGLGTRLSAGLKPVTDFLTTVASSSDPFGTLLDGLEKVSPAFAIIRDVFDAIKPQLPVIQADFAQLGAAIGAGLAQYGPQLATGLGQIVTAIVPLIPQILTLIPPLLQLIPPLLQLATVIIPPLVSLLVSLGPALQLVVDGFSGGAEAIGDFFKLLSGDTSLGAFQGQILAIKGPFGDLQNFLHDAGTNLAGFLQSVGGFFSTIGSNVAGNIQLLVTGIQNVLGFIGSIPGKVGDFLSSIPNLIAFNIGVAIGLLLALPAKVVGFLSQIPAAAGAVFAQVASFAGTVVGNIADFFASLPAKVVGFFTSLVSSAIGVLQGVPQGAATAVNGVVGFFVSLPAKILDALKGAGSFLLDVGKNIVQGLINGITGAIGGAVKAVTGLANSLLKGIKAGLGIHSPSTLFAGIGRNVVAGLENGLNASNNLGSIMSGLSAQVAGEFQSSISTTAKATAETSASTGPTAGSAVVAVDPTAQTLMRTLIKAVGNIQPGWIVPESLAQVNQAGSSRLATVGAS